jgi:hypothetical protein
MGSALVTAWSSFNIFNKENVMMDISHFISFVFNSLFRNTTDIWLEFFFKLVTGQIYLSPEGGGSVFSGALLWLSPPMGTQD